MPGLNLTADAAVKEAAEGADRSGGSSDAHWINLFLINFPSAFNRGIGARSGGGPPGGGIELQYTLSSGRGGGAAVGALMGTKDAVSGTCSGGGGGGGGVGGGLDSILLFFVVPLARPEGGPAEPGGSGGAEGAAPAATGCRLEDVSALRAANLSINDGPDGSRPIVQSIGPHDFKTGAGGGGAGGGIDSGRDLLLALFCKFIA